MLFFQKKNGAIPQNQLYYSKQNIKCSGKFDVVGGFNPISIIVANLDQFPK